MQLSRIRGVATILGIVVGIASLGQASIAQTVADLETHDWRSIDPQASGVCTESLCRAFVELSKVMNGQTPDVTWLNQHKGTPHPIDMFNSGGSENITVIVRTALYYHEGSPHNSWLYKYYNIQLSPGYPYFLDDEIFSSVYTQGVVGATIAIRAEAVRRGHTGLSSKSSTFLKRYWGYLTLAAVLPKPGMWLAYNKHGTVQKAPGPWWGYNLGLVGRRVYANGFGGSSTSLPGYGLQGLLLAMALQHPGRAVTQDLTVSPAYWGGLRAAVEAVGYNLDGNGKVNLQSKTVPASAFGLENYQRNAWRNFIANNGGGLNASWGVIVASGIGQQQVDHDITILRTDWQVISWFGRRGSIGHPPGDAKGGPWFIARARRGTQKTDFVTRSLDKWGQPGSGTTFADWNEICAIGVPPDGLPELCFPRPGGRRYEIVIGRDGTECWGGNCVPPL